MASIQVRPRASGQSAFEVCFRTPEGRLTGRTFHSLQAAEVFAATFPPSRPGRRGARGASLAERIERMSEVDDNGCWIWQGQPSNRGYGLMSVRNDGKTRTRGAHRVSYETHVGPIPDGLVIDHLCRVRMCVNPSHLEPVLQRENIMRSPIAIGALNAAKTHCPQGHPYDEANTFVVHGRGYVGRLCRICMKASAARTYAKKSA